MSPSIQLASVTLPPEIRLFLQLPVPQQMTGTESSIIMDMFQAHMEMYQAHMASNVNSKSDMWGWGVCTLQMVIGSADADDFES